MECSTAIGRPNHLTEVTQSLYRYIYIAKDNGRQTTISQCKRMGTAMSLGPF